MYRLVFRKVISWFLVLYLLAGLSAGAQREDRALNKTGSDAGAIRTEKDTGSDLAAEEAAGLATLEYTVTLNEETDSGSGRLVLMNLSDETQSRLLKLPMTSAGFTAGTLQLSASREILRPEEDQVWVNLPSGESLTLSYEYRTGQSLTNARVLAAGFGPAIFGENGRIGHFSITVELREGDIPLVKEISPINYRLEGTRLSLELFDFAPGPLLDSFTLTKETYRNLKGNREYELSEVGQYVLDHYKEWFREGLPLSKDVRGGFKLIQSLFPGNPAENELAGLWNEQPALLQILRYLGLRDGEAISGNVVEDILSYYSRTMSWWPLTAEVSRQKQGHELLTAAVIYTPQPSLEGIVLTEYSQKLNDPLKTVVLREIKEREYLTAGSSHRDIYVGPWAGDYRVAQFWAEEITDRQVFEEYLDVTGCEVVVRQMLLDDRDLTLFPKVEGRSPSWNEYWTCFSFAGGNNLSSSDFVYKKSALGPALFLDREDEQLAALSIPAFTHYKARVVTMEDGRITPSYLINDGWRNMYYGMPVYRESLESGKAREMLTAALERRTERREAVLVRLALVRTDFESLRNVPVDPETERGDRRDLVTVSYDLSLEEASGQAGARLILKNTGASLLCTSITLPMTSAGYDQESLWIAGAPAAEGAQPAVRVLLGPEETSVITYGYRTASDLTSTGVLAADFATLVFAEDGRIGHVGISLEMSEADLPLVREISPINFRVEGTVISVDLYDFSPSPLLDRFLLVKETYRNLKGSREYDPSEEEQFLLDHYRQWFREGLGLTDLSHSGAYQFFALMLGEENSRSSWERGQRTQFDPILWSKHAAFHQIWTVLILREIRQAGLGPDAVRKALGQGGDQIGEAWPVTAELLCQALELPLHVMAVGETKNPSLEGIPLLGKVYDREATVANQRDTWIKRPVTESTLLSSELNSLNLKRSTYILPYRVSVLGTETGASAAQLQEYLDVTGCEIYVQSKLMDRRAEGLLEGGSFVTQCWSCAASGNLTVEDLQSVDTAGMMNATLLFTYTVLLTEEDPLLSSLTVPAFTQYHSQVIQDAEGNAVGGYEFRYGQWVSACGGIEFYKAVTETEAGRAMLSARDAERLKRVLTAQEEITAALVRQAADR